MSGYEELVALLRKKYDKAPMVMEAADAIEDLSREYESLGADLTDACERVRRLRKQNEKWEEAVKTALDFIPCWVSVTERLPDEKQAEDVLCWIMGGDPKAEGYCVSGCYNTLAKSWHLDADWVDPWKITHWMPAPQGPKPAEDTNAPTGPYDLLYEEGRANTT